MFTLVVADDDPDSRLLVARALAEGNMFRIVAEAVTAEDALAQASSLHPDIVVLDPMLAGDDGLWALPRIRQAAPRTKVVLRSAFPSSELRFAALSGGAIGYLEKSRSPLDLADDLLAVCGLLDVVEAGIREAKAHLGEHLQTPRLARRFVKHALERWGLRSEVELVELLVSELVTNSIVHGRSEVEVSVSLGNGVVRVAVFDSSLDPPVRKVIQAEEGSGRGLLMLDALSTAWGTGFTPSGKNVWFEIRTTFQDA